MEFFNKAFSSLQDNEFFGAGAGLFTIGLGWKFLKQGGRAAKILAHRYLVTSIEISSRDRSYKWLLEWLTNNGIGRKPQHLSVETNLSLNSTGKINGQFKFIPGPGNHIFYYSGKFIRVERIRENTPITAGSSFDGISRSNSNLNNGLSPSPFEIVKLTTIGKDDTFFKNILKNSMSNAIDFDQNVTIFYIPATSDWRQFGNPKRRRSLDSVVLDKGISNDILEDVTDFIKNREWYQNRGIPYRRGYLLHGPPGVGKSSFISALAGHLEYSICILNIGDRGLTDERLHHLLNVVPDQSIILLEDIDVAFNSRSDKSDQSYMQRLTMSGLLNALDGVASSEGRLIFMTTNYVERLDEAIIRPGRVDSKYLIGNCSSFQILQMYMKFYPKEPEHLSRIFLDKLSKQLDGCISPAQLQGYFMLYKDNGQAAIDNIPTYFK
ncbi:hypothetical protein A3Q56_03461 [Intoshia linei]|uniref:Mitochondrial chaperone BCS1 n=1 Tax=Intoshia linei TaxID=1819745 RepID=A0A177B568_9BILA|nr:hypothetical protein A3Q56_03461 [Intoshia linei]